MAKQKASETEPVVESAEPAPPQIPGIKKKVWIYIAIITVAVWAFTIQTESTVMLVITSILTAALVVILFLALRMIRKQKNLVGLLHGSTQSAEARKDALAKLSAGKDANQPVQIFARAQLLAADDPPAALKLLEPMELKAFPAAMQDDVALLKTQLYLGQGRTAEARKTADTINVDNPARAETRSLAAITVAEAWARTGKPKEALALIENVEPPKQNAAEFGIQVRIVRVFAKFAANQRQAARNELVALAKDDVNYLGKFVMPQFRVHPELQKLARQVIEQNPGARKMAMAQAKTQKR